MTYINIPLYKDYNIFKESGLTLNEDQNFEELNDPIFQVLNIYTTFKNKEFKHIRVCFIDELYLEWLNENNKEKNKNSVVDYINNMSDDVARNLWKKYKLCESIDLMSIVFYVPTEELEEITHYKIDSNDSIIIKELICDTLKLNEKDLYVPGYISTFNEASKREDDLQLISREYFNSGINIVFGLLEEQIIEKNIGITAFCIPVIFRMEIDCFFTKETIEKMLEDNSLMKSIDFEPVENILKTKFKNPVILIDRLVLVCELQDIYNSFLNALYKKVKKVRFLNIFKPKKKRN